MAIRVLIVEDEPEFTRRFSTAVLSDSELGLVAAVSSGAAGIAMLDLERPDVLLVDLGLPDISGVEVIRHAALRHPQCDVLVITMFGDDDHVVASIEAGASGYLLKDASAERIATSIRELHAGGAPISPGIARRVLARFRLAVKPIAVTGPDEPATPTSPLSARETELLRLTAKGLTFENIGELLGISPHTVVAHVKKIYRKLAVHSRGEAVYEASQMGLL
ncbi:DNA-binding NarL/FixJ family response regulator [Variovorax sp. GrIS 2.14]|jgi:DNA-binding NarL/FixJ family response regulator|uniref:response regulator transcription factor n=1 Tax=unclassified Variovorax TaxID=663243 RepID=UPI002B2272DD|nr:response regulator transcription factor [Variovorax sp. RTB1]MEB0110899.1 response regulator transcription factor [Variovorax sp. RTB1]